MPSKVFSAALVGLDAQTIEVEIDTSYGLRYFEIVGLPDKSVQEARERVGAAIESSGFKSPHHQSIRVLVSLAPADVKKEGSSYDLPIALAFLLTTKKISFETKDKIFIGELALDGRLRPIKGALSFALSAKKNGFNELLLPEQNAREAGLVRGIKVIGVKTLEEAIELALDSEYALTGAIYSRSPKSLAIASREFRVGNLYINAPCTGALVGRQPFGGAAHSGVGSKAGGPDYLHQFVIPRAISENTLRQGIAPS